MSMEPHSFYYTADGRKYLVRAIQPSDKHFMTEGFDHLSEQSRYLRFFAGQSKLTETQLKFFTEVDGINHVSWGILDVTDEAKPVGVGIGRFIRLKEQPDTAETAITIVDTYQRKGLGNLLFAVLNIVAGHLGVKTFRYYILGSNAFVLDSLNHLDVIKREHESDISIIDIAVHGDHTSMPDIPRSQNIISMMKVVEGLIF